MRSSFGLPTLTHRRSPKRQFFSVTLENANDHSRARFDLPLDGFLDSDQSRALKHFLRCRRTARRKHIARGTIAILADLARQYPGRIIEIVSGYRSPPYGAPRSKHFSGHAIDLRVRGVALRVLRDYLWHAHHLVGVGYYPQDRFIHIDWRPNGKDTAWTGFDNGRPNRLNPRWSRRSGRLMARR